MNIYIGHVLRSQLRFHQLLGFHTLPLPGDATRCTATLLRVWAGFLLTFFTVMTLHCVTSEDDYLYHGDKFGFFIDALKYIFGELAVLAIYMESLCRRRHMVNFWRIYSELQLRSGFFPANSLLSQCRQLYGYLSTLFVTVSTELLLWVIFTHLQSIYHHLFLFWITFQPLVFIVHMRNMQFVLYMDLLKQQLQQLEHELGLLAEYSHFASSAASFAGFENYLRRRVRQKQLHFDRIYELHLSFQQAFGFSILAVLLMIYVRILIDCYFMYYTIYQGVNNIDYCLLVPAILEIPAFIYTSQGCMKLVKRIAFQLHNILGGLPSVSLQIQNFSLQILHQPMRINCLGIATLDGYLLTTIVCSVTTYMIYFIQFMPKFGNFNQLLMY